MICTDYLPLHSAEKVKLQEKNPSAAEQPFPITVRREIGANVIVQTSFLSFTEYNYSGTSSAI